MVRKKIDNRIRALIENGVALNHRSMFVVVGAKAREQVVILHHMLSKAQIKAKPTVLWCFKKELGFSTHRGKRMRELNKKRKMGLVADEEEDPFDMFITSNRIRWCFYNESHRILGNTYGMLVLQDFEAITPNLLARTIETVEGGGLVVITLNTLTSLKQLFTMTMDVHSRYRTESTSDMSIVARFNERFLLSLASLKNCLCIDDQLNVLPISSHFAEIEPIPKAEADKFKVENPQLVELKEQLADTQPIGSLVNLCKTLDQAKAVLKFIDSISEKTLRTTVSLTAARGRGKSAALGLAISAAVAFNYSNIFVTSPSPENLKTLFEFILKGFDALGLQEHMDYEIIQSTNEEFNKAIVRINVFKDHRQSIQYVHPADAAKNKLFGQAAELVVIDEAAAIPLPIVKALLGPYLVFMSSTINGYEGTGRSLSLKLLQQLRHQSQTMSGGNPTASRTLAELQLNESIRYRPGDPVEAWLNSVLCLDATIVEQPPSIGCPSPDECQLYYISRDTLFSYHKASESFLQRLMGIYVSAHYKNSPNDLQMMSDAPAHHLFCLLPPQAQQAKSKAKLPEVLCFMQVCLEGEISSESVMSSLSRGKRAAGDLIPWTISQQFQDHQFGSLSGARVVRIAVNPNYQGMGYGTRALKLLEDYYRSKFNIDLIDDSDHDEEMNAKDNRMKEDSTDNSDQIVPRKNLPPLLLGLHERKAERLDYVGTSFGLTAELLKFWKKSGYVPVYLRQTPNELTGEHSAIMLKILLDEARDSSNESNWLAQFWIDFRRRFVNLLGYQFKEFRAAMAMNILQNPSSCLKSVSSKSIQLNKERLEEYVTLYDLRRLEDYSRSLCDYHLIMDMVPTLAKLFFTDQLGPDFHLSAAQSAILLGVGLQYKTVEQMSEELNLPVNQLLALFQRSIAKMTKVFRQVEEKAVEESLGPDRSLMTEEMDVQSKGDELNAELEEAGQVIERAERKELKKLLKSDQILSQYAIKGAEEDWEKEIQRSGGSSGSNPLIRIKRLDPSLKKDTKLGNNKGKDKKTAFKKRFNKFGKKKHH